MISLLALILTAAPAVETIGSVDGPFLWVDTRASVDNAAFTSRFLSSYQPLSGFYASGYSVLGQAQLLGGWGLRVRDQRLTLTASTAATGEVTAPELLQFPHPRFDVAPVLLSASVPLPIDTVVLVPILGVTLPTRNSFNNDPVVSLQPQLRFRGSFGSLLLGVSGLLNLPAITKWDRPGFEGHAYMRCPAEETRCRWPVTREQWLASLSVQAEYWFRDELSAGLRTKLEFREENLGQLAPPSGAPEASVTTPEWSVVDLQGNVFGSWAFSRFAGVSASFGLSWQQRMTQRIPIDRTGWNASISIWFRTDSRLSRFWLDR